MKKEELISFILESNKAGYAEGDLKNWTKENDGSNSISFERGPWRSHDNFFGGEPYGGRVVILYENLPYWIMVYYGWVNKVEEINSVFGVIRNALKEMPREYPFRGPKEFRDSEYLYSNYWNGDVSRFEGKEKINKKSTFVYQANYFGGLVDSHKGI
ncbi:MAG: hypothetical protein GY865_17710 [candidate division Zixibacteria bacterium]|nr:hypothetical protein [candidate division Zixibacteria bacterium]